MAKLQPDDKVIGKTGLQKASPFQSRLDLLLEPLVQHIVQKYVAEHW